MSPASGRAPAGVRLERLEKRYGRTVAVHPLDLAIEPGELMVLVGPSGCGKTTVLRLIAGLEDATGGDVFIGDRRVTDEEPADRDVAMVFQSYALYPHMTVRQNLAFGLRMRRRAAADIERQVAWAAATLGLEALLDRRPAQLSGGQKQRVAFGRAMVREPHVFLFDEPLSNLDARLRADMRREIADLHRRLGVTMVYVTHDQVEAMTLGGRIAVMRDGRIEQVAPPMEIYRRPATLYVASFIGTPSINLASGRITVAADGAWLLVEPEGGSRAPAADRAASLRLPLAGAAADGEAVALGVRAEHLIVGAPGAAADFVATVQRVEPLGNEVLVQVDGPGGTPWVARAAGDWPGAAGDRVWLRLAREQAHVFAAGGARRELRLVEGAARCDATR